MSVIVPLQRLADPRQLDRLLASVLSDGVSSYFVWTPGVTEERLLADHAVFAGLLKLISGLVERGIPVGHLHGGYVIAALHDVGIAALVHHFGWVDRGEPAEQSGGGPRSCQTYVPSVRHGLRFDRAYELGRSLDAADYAERFCGCAFCAGAFANGQHPLDLLLEQRTVSVGASERHTPTARAVALNTWHHLLSRRKEIEAFNAHTAAEVIDQDLRRAATLTGDRDTGRFRRLADELRAA